MEQHVPLSPQILRDLTYPRYLNSSPPQETMAPQVTSAPPPSGEFPMTPLMRSYVIASAIMVAAAFTAVSLRVVCRKITNSGIRSDDWLILASLPQGLAMFIMQVVFSKIGMGHSIKEVHGISATMQKLVVAMDVVGATSLATIKLSVLCFYLRVFEDAKLRKVIMGVGLLVLVWTVGNVMEPFLICTPFQYTYDQSIPGICGSKKGVSISIGIFSAVTDFIIIALPIPAIWKLPINQKRKVAATSLFLIGLSVSVAAMVRIVYLIETDVRTDFTSTGGLAIFLAVLEIHLSIFCVSLPMTRPLFQRIKFPWKLPKLGRGSGRWWSLPSVRSSPSGNRDNELDNLEAPKQVDRSTTGTHTTSSCDNAVSSGEFELGHDIPRPPPARSYYHWQVGA
ncbi:hypothetical protein F5B20DRAFT_577875 [Whalleya microplaca]|nr:hypothetical protein F5B20DRAFT_577875 [Whalleya microplaca]